MPEKALIVRRSFAEQNHDTHLRLIGALHQACLFCDDPANRGRLAEILSLPRYLNLPVKLLQSSLGENLLKNSLSEAPAGEFHIFSRYDVNRPTIDKANWLLAHMNLCGLVSDISEEQITNPAKIFREDLFQEALDIATSPRNEPPRKSTKPTKRASKPTSKS